MYSVNVFPSQFMSMSSYQIKNDPSQLSAHVIYAHFMCISLQGYLCNIATFAYKYVGETLPTVNQAEVYLMKTKQ